MGLTKQYLRYVSTGKWNIISNSSCNCAFVILQGQEGRFLAVGACEDIIVWDLRLGEKALSLEGDKFEVTALRSSPVFHYLAAGYSDGSVRVFDTNSKECSTVFAGHKSAVRCLAYDNDGHRLASGSNDTDIIVWDVVDEKGIGRLSGHKGPITQIQFLKNFNILLSSSKDTFVKCWDLDTFHCFKTIVGHKTEIWGLTIIRNDKYIVTGSGESELKVWEVNLKSIKTEISNKILDIEDVENDSEDLNDISPLQFKKIGSILRTGKGRVMSMCADKSGEILVCHSNNDLVELFYFRSEEEIQKIIKKRKKRMQKKILKGAEETSEELSLENSRPTLKDEVMRLPFVKSSDKIKIRNVDLILGEGGELRISLNLINNSIELYSLYLKKKDECKCLKKISLQGHHSEVRSVNFSSDNLAICSGSNDEVKIWNRSSLSCLQTIKTGYVLCTSFVPGDRHVIAGLKDGKLLIIDIAVGIILEEISAHSKEVWSICLTPDVRGCVTGSGDTTVKFWQFELIKESSTKVLSLLHIRTLKLEESVLAVKISPNNSLLAVALLDSTVKIFFMDTLKFFISLYGHKLPVLCLDISYDSTLIITGSADRNVKIWGLDFGDCHRSLFAHDDSVSQVNFIPETHQFFSCGKDGKIKQWDADSFDKILTLPGHFGYSWNLNVSPNGKYVVSCGADHVLRLYERTEEILVLEDEAEEEREAEEGLATGDVTNVAGQVNLNLPSKKTVGSEKAAEQIMESLGVYKEYKEELLSSNMKSCPLPPLMVAYQVSSAEDFLVQTLLRIRSSDLEEALLLLPFNYACDLLSAVPDLLTHSYETEIICRVLIFLLKIHHGPIVSNQNLVHVLKNLQQLAFDEVQHLRDTVGVNLHGLQFIQRTIESREGVHLFKEAILEKKKKDKQKKRKEKCVKRAVMLL